MPRPQKTTRDAWLDTFADWPVDTQEDVMELAALLHRQAKRRKGKDEDSMERAAEQGALKLREAE